MRPRYDETIDVHPGSDKNPPKDYSLDPTSIRGGIKLAYLYKSLEVAHHCGVCGGWVEGDPLRSSVNSLGNLCGRRGTVWHCRKCGVELAFVGMKS